MYFRILPNIRTLPRQHYITFISIQEIEDFLSSNLHILHKYWQIFLCDHCYDKNRSQYQNIIKPEMGQREIQCSGLTEGHKPESFYPNNPTLKAKQTLWNQHIPHSPHPTQTYLMNQHFLTMEKKIKYS